MPSAPEAPARSALLERRRQSVLLWGTWLVSNVLVFSIADFFHPYNLVILAPAICALAAISIVVLWDDYNRAGGVGWAFPAALVTTALIQAGIIAESPPWLPWLPALVVGSAIVAAMVLLLTGGTSPPQRGTARAAARAGCLSVLLAPILWASVPVWHYGNAELPVAGPDLFSAAVEPPARTMAFIAPPTFTRFLLAHHHHERFVLAVRYAGVAAPVMLATGKAVLTYGGYLGTDHILNAGGLARLVAAGAVRYFWMLPPSPTGENQDDLDRWVRRWCDRVNQRLWQAPPGYGPAGPLLYRCADTNRRALARTLRG